jgi:hypothetical protein
VRREEFGQKEPEPKHDEALNGREGVAIVHDLFGAKVCGLTDSQEGPPDHRNCLRSCLADSPPTPVAVRQGSNEQPLLQQERNMADNQCEEVGVSRGWDRQPPAGRNGHLEARRSSNIHRQPVIPRSKAFPVKNYGGIQ